MIVLQAFSVVRLFWHYVFPVSVFAFCYGRIFLTIRRQSKMVSGHVVGRGQGSATVTATSVNHTPGQDQQQGTAAATGGKLSHTEINRLIY